VVAARERHQAAAVEGGIVAMEKAPVEVELSAGI
jgi:hypothetical protein